MFLSLKTYKARLVPQCGSAQNDPAIRSSVDGRTAESDGWEVVGTEVGPSREKEVTGGHP